MQLAQLQMYLGVMWGFCRGCEDTKVNASMYAFIAQTKYFLGWLLRNENKTSRIIAFTWQRCGLH